MRSDDARSAIELRCGELRLALRPDLGGAVAGLWFSGVPVLRSTEPSALRSVRDGASFALLPYSNRIGGRSFPWRGRRYAVTPNVSDEPYPRHGVAWQRAWQVAHATDTLATLAFTHPSDAQWPFAFHAEQTFELTPTALRITLAVANIDARDTPMGLGWHPYFVRRPGCRLQMALSHRWEADAAKLPTRRVTQRGLDAEVSSLDLDHCFDGWRGVAQITDDVLALRLSSSLKHAVVYMPRGHDFFCVEPVSHVNNALRSEDPPARGVIALGSGDSTEAWMQLDVAPA